MLTPAPTPCGTEPTSDALQNRVNEQQGTSEVTPQRVSRTREVWLKELEEARNKFFETTQEVVSESAMRAMLNELSEIERKFVEWENRFVRTHRISALVCTFAAASFVGEETAQRCKRRLYESKKKTVTTRTYRNVAVIGEITVPIWISKRMLNIKLFILSNVDVLVLGKDILTKFKDGYSQLLLMLEDGEVIRTLKREEEEEEEEKTTHLE